MQFADRSKRRRRAAVVMLFSCAAVASGCGKVSEAPPDQRPINANAEGLAKFFREECIDQKNGDWIRERSASIRAQCTFLDNSDCAYNHDGRVEWNATTTSGETLSIKLRWPHEQSPGKGPPDGLLTCSLRVPESIGRELLKAAEEIVKTDPRLGDAQYSTFQELEKWVWRQPGSVSTAHDNDEASAIVAGNHIEVYHQSKEYWELCYAVFPHRARNSCWVI